MKNWERNICNFYHRKRGIMNIKRFSKHREEIIQRPIEKWAKDINKLKKMQITHIKNAQPHS